MKDDPTTRDALVEALGGLIAGLHVPRSLGSVMVPKEYDVVRDLIRDSGWSSAEEVAAKLRAALIDEAEPVVPELTADVPQERVVPSDPDSPMAWALVGIGAFTVLDDSGAVCTMALGDRNNVARRLQERLDAALRGGPDDPAPYREVIDLAMPMTGRTDWPNEEEGHSAPCPYADAAEDIPMGETGCTCV